MGISEKKTKNKLMAGNYEEDAVGGERCVVFRWAGPKVRSGDF